MLLYTSLMRGLLIVNTTDLSQGGVFVKYPHLPKIDEVVTYKMLDQKGDVLVTGMGHVVYCQKKKGLEAGFAIAFSEPLSKREEGQVMATSPYFKVPKTKGLMITNYNPRLRS